jgi:hypothetical protein
LAGPSTEHFINLARDSSGLASNDLCPLAQECVLSAIQVEVALLSSNGADDEAKLEVREQMQKAGVRLALDAALGK